jgi:hypothetical protein
MFGWMEAISEWAEKDEVPFSFSNQPDFVKRPHKIFNSNIYDPYDSSFSGRDWLSKIEFEPDPLASYLFLFLNTWRNGM